ncbi:hypothetical protein NO2_1423 [Candidatus Termititenax persephonae]|uniref:Uncharacterized protein n=1 Tax=Candidatus Termititenax persephonae TaxID=2218525 RepID=A0A388TJ03_9BACT|nr:hypothetical protein NO2_1423 [Candidatus Termititenax persephonae]
MDFTNGQINFTSDGGEILDDTPHSLSLSFERPMHIRDRLRLQVATFAQNYDDGESETFEEADDFDVGDDRPSLETNKSFWETHYDMCELRKAGREQEFKEKEIARLKEVAAQEKAAKLKAWHEFARENNLIPETPGEPSKAPRVDSANKPSGE